MWGAIVRPPANPQTKMINSKSKAKVLIWGRWVGVLKTSVKRESNKFSLVACMRKRDG